MIFSSLLATIKANHSALTVHHSSNIITCVTFLAQYNQKVPEEISQMNRFVQVIKVDGTCLNRQARHGFTRKEAKILDTQLSTLSLTARFDEDIEVWAVSIRPSHTALNTL